MTNNNNKRKREKMLVFNENDHIETPTELYQALDNIHHFDFDPCPLNCTEFDGLSVEWKQSNFVNPPFSKISKWIKKGVEELINNKRKSVFLITARVGNRYWFNYVWPFASEIMFLNRIRFKNYKLVFPLPVAIVVFDPDKPPPVEREKEQHLTPNITYYIA